MKFYIKKIITLIITLLIVSFLTFLAFDLISGDPAISKLGTQATPEKVEALREEMGLNDPLPVRYARWISGFVTGDLGESYSYHLPVGQMLLEKLPVTLTMMGMSFIMILLLGIPLGILCARHENGIVDHILSVLNQIAMSIPPFFLGVLLTFLFGLVFKLFTPGGYVSYQDSAAGFLGYLILPSFAIALPKSAMTVKLLRSSVLGQLRLDYVKTARSRGNTQNGVLYRHVLRNACIPVLTFLGMALADMLASSIIIEQVFGIPGLGRMLVGSISGRDYPVVQAIITFLAAFVVIVNFLVDMGYRWLDPRVRLGGSGNE
ncbi:ABC transporter permease [Diplocloster agilis]|uniref:ABC transporter permease n=1 Tax=Diplocloster agilis TaxID=2850323 RepID=A0A949K0B3_9FIRM|nr:ABC transporter permease [Diplocloster agilis]MBU9738533.1 ABC transporter permease [Diplocloster agilis]MBU9746560.1 ABC transporter permease [Diplocloster agilis]